MNKMLTMLAGATLALASAAASAGTATVTVTCRVAQPKSRAICRAGRSVVS